ncbi:MAG: SCO family protein [Methylophilaceae bacterium]|jgi:protein SCO1
MLKKLICLLFLIFVACGSETPNFHGSDITEAKLNGRIELTSHKNENFDSNSLLGNVVAIFFGFTNCPDICPTTLTELKLLSTQLNDPAHFKVLFVSVDPGRDTVEMLNDYIPRFGDNVTGLTGSKENIKKVADQYKIFYQAIPQGNDYTIDHSAGIYLMDKKGRVRLRFPYGTEPSLIIEDINKLL